VPPTRSAMRNPGVGRCIGMVNLDSKLITLTAVFAAIYAAGVVVLAPISYGIVQVRVSDALIPLSVIFGWPAICGVTLGCLVANVYGGFGLMDVLLGSIANLIAAYSAYRLRKKPFLACISASLIVSIIVGSYLWVLFNVPWEVSLLGILTGSLISINILGYGLLKTLLRIGHTPNA